MYDFVLFEDMEHWEFVGKNDDEDERDLDTEIQPWNVFTLGEWRDPDA